MIDMNLDYAKNMDLTVRRGGYFELTFEVLQDGSPFHLSNGMIELVLFNNKFTSIPRYVKSADNYVSIVSNLITIKFWQDLTNLNTRKYFWALRYTDSNNQVYYWIVGNYKVISGTSEESTTGDAMGNIIINILSGQGGGGSVGSSLYNALLTQVSVGAPAAVVFTNTIVPDTLVWSRVGVGVYKLSRYGGFDLSKTVVTPTIGASTYITPNYVLIKFDSENNLLIETFGSDLQPADGVLSDFSIKLEIFN